MPQNPVSPRLYDYLRPHVVDLAPSNEPTWFRKLERQRILEAEARLGYTFPRHVRAFYEEIGFGVLRAGAKAVVDDSPGAPWRQVANRILHPTTIAALSLGEAEINPNPPLRQNEWPVFEATEGDYFIVDPFAGDPAIYTRYKIDKVADNFSDLIHRLYHEDVAFHRKRRW